jgi:hypothetical protein
MPLTILLQIPTDLHELRNVGKSSLTHMLPTPLILLGKRDICVFSYPLSTVNHELTCVGGCWNSKWADPCAHGCSMCLAIILSAYGEGTCAIISRTCACVYPICQSCHIKILRTGHYTQILPDLVDRQLIHKRCSSRAFCWRESKLAVDCRPGRGASDRQPSAISQPSRLGAAGRGRRGNAC